MATTEDRIKAGLGSIPEKYFQDHCDRYFIPNVSTRIFHNHTPLFDRINGDFVIISGSKVIRVDVKGGAIAKSSIEDFKGEIFVIYDSSNNSAKNPYVIVPQVLKNLIKPWSSEQFDELVPSGKPGIYYSRLGPIFKESITLDDYLKKL